MKITVWEKNTTRIYQINHAPIAGTSNEEKDSVTIGFQDRKGNKIKLVMHVTEARGIALAIMSAIDILEDSR